MLKIIGRIMVILLVSGLIAGAIYLVVQKDPALLGLTNRRAGFESRSRNNFQSTNSGTAAPLAASNHNVQPTRFRDGERGFEGGRISVGRGLLGIAGNLILFSILTLLVIAVQRLSALPRRKRPVQAG